jgi:outer membrane murein-binding lipoprotein Lpp
MEREVDKLKEDMNLSRKAAEQVRMELQMANQTIEEQRRSLTKFSKELQVHQ